MYQYNEYDESQIKRLQLERQKRKRKRIKRVILAIIALIACIALMLSPAFKFKSIEVLGDNDGIVKDVEKQLKAYQEKYFIITTKGQIEESVKSDPRIKNVKVDISLLGDLTVTVTESKNIAFAKIDKTYYYLNDIGKIVALDQDVKVDQTLPQCLKFDSEETLSQLAGELQGVPSLILNDTSEITFIPAKNDPLLIQFSLANNNFIKIRMDEMDKLSTKFDYSAELVRHPKGYIFSFEGQYIYVKKVNANKK